MSVPLLTGLVFAAGLLLFFAGLDAARGPRPVTVIDPSLPAPPQLTLRERLESLVAARPSAQAPVPGAPPSRRQTRQTKLAEELSRADLRLRTYEFLLIRFASAALLALIGLVRFGFGAQLFVMAVVGYFIPRWYLGHRRKARQKAFANQLGDTLVLMSNALKTGYSISQSIDTVASRASPPISQEFDRVAREINLGAPLEESLGRMVQRVASGDMDMVMTAIGIQRKIGGNLAEILDNIAETIRDRVRISGEMQTLTAQARGSGYMITGMPIVLGVFMYFVTPQYFKPMTEQFIGIVMLAIAGLFVFLGQLIMGKIATVDV